MGLKEMEIKKKRICNAVINMKEKYYAYETLLQKFQHFEFSSQKRLKT